VLLNICFSLFTNISWGEVAHEVIFIETPFLVLASLEVFSWECATKYLFLALYKY
jgi:hypothetical protein